MVNLKTRHEVERLAKSGRLLNSVSDEMTATWFAGVHTGNPDRTGRRRIRPR